MKRAGRSKTNLVIEKLDAKTVRVILPCGRKTILDKKNLKFLKIFPRWDFAGGYVRCSRVIETPYGTLYERRYLHKVIVMPKKGLEADHINRIPLDNRESNLRAATRSENMKNSLRVKNKTSKYKGVGVEINKKTGKIKFRASIRDRKKTIFIGYFLKESEAAIAYNKMAKKIHGRFAYINEI